MAQRRCPVYHALFKDQRLRIRLYVLSAQQGNLLQILLRGRRILIFLERLCPLNQGASLLLREGVFIRLKLYPELFLLFCR